MATSRQPIRCSLSCGSGTIGTTTEYRREARCEPSRVRRHPLYSTGISISPTLGAFSASVRSAPAAIVNRASLCSIDSRRSKNSCGSFQYHRFTCCAEPRDREGHLTHATNSSRSRRSPDWATSARRSSRGAPVTTRLADARLRPTSDGAACVRERRLGTPDDAPSTGVGARSRAPWGSDVSGRHRGTPDWGNASQGCPRATPDGGNAPQGCPRGTPDWGNAPQGSPLGTPDWETLTSKMPARRAKLCRPWTTARGP